MFNRLIQLMVLLVLTHFSNISRAYQAEIKQVVITVQDNQVSGGIFPVDIPDGNATGVDIFIDATGLFTSNIVNLTLGLGVVHSWVGDLQVTLYAPNDIAQLVIFSNKGYSRDDPNGDDSDLNGVYEFNDLATKDFWVEGAGSGFIPVDTYRTSTGGNSYSYFGGCTTRLKGAFAGLTPAQANGLWRLHVADIAADDVGQILSIDLFADQLGPVEVMFKNSFEELTPVEILALKSNISYPQASGLLGNCQKAQYDFTGSGVSDYVGFYTFQGHEFVFLVGNNGPNPDGLTQNILVGENANNMHITSGGDFDGDGITDIVTYEDGSGLFNGNRKYVIRRSSRPNDVKMFYHAQAGLENTQIGDYNGDGLDELSWYIEAKLGIGIVSLQNGVLEILNDNTPIGVNKRIAGGFDHNGDGLDDFVVFYDDGLGLGNQIVKVFSGMNGILLYDSVTSFLDDEIHQLPGNFNPNNLNLSGLGFYEAIIGSYLFRSVDDSNNFVTVFLETTFGISPTDIPITGDYDGDGIDDFGVWRPNTDSLGNRFIIRPSNFSGSLITVLPDGALNSDYPVANSRFQ